VETAIAFGSGKSLVGTISCPRPFSPGASGVGVVFFNAGVVHRVGPHRINVKIARALAAMGIPSIRFDLSGLGDSGRPGANAEHSHGLQASKDIRDAIDALAAASGVSKFVLCAVCSGTVHSYDAAAADARVVGLVLLDSYIYPTAKSRRKHFLLRLKRRLKEGTVINWFADKVLRSGGVSEAADKGASRDERGNGPGFFAFRPPEAEFAATLTRLADRGARICFVYAGSGFENYNYAEQFNDVFAKYRLSPSVSAKFLSDIDHTATRVAAQRELVEFVGGWFQKNFPSVEAN
jgi:pimeloyl-ACP methyl ester carboxylesterase